RHSGMSATTGAWRAPDAGGARPRSRPWRGPSAPTAGTYRRPSMAPPPPPGCASSPPATPCARAGCWTSPPPDGRGAPRVRRALEALPPGAQLLQSPFNLDARYAGKRATTWIGCRVYLTETCDADMPHLITHVATLSATTHDSDMTGPIQDDLAAHDRLPG